MVIKHKAPILVAFLFYLAVQCYGIWFMQYNHPGPLGLADSAAYIANISFSKDYPLNILDTPDIDQAAYSWFWGVTARLLDIAPETMFNVNFYVGLFLMGLVLTTLFRKIDPSPVFAAVGMMMFAFYEGNGAYHGFFWVVPSFYAMMLFLLAAIALFHSPRPILYGAPLLLLLIVTHSTGIYLAALTILGFFIQEVLFRHNTKAFRQIAVFLAAAGLLLLASSQLFQINFIPLNKLSWQAHQFTFQFDLIKQELSKYTFAKYFYGLYTPVLACGIYYSITQRQYTLISLLIAALSGYIALTPLVEYGFRLFYPLEVITWLVMAYGTSNILKNIVRRDRPGTSLPVAFNTLIIGLIIGLFILFIYNAAQQKTRHHYDFKFYHLRFFEESAFRDYLQQHPGRKIAAYAAHTGNYQGLDGGWKHLQFVFRAGVDNIRANPSEWLIIGETHRFYEKETNGFKLFLPAAASLEIKNPALEPGRYRVELRDTGIRNIRNIAVVAGGKTLNQWDERPSMVKIPDTGMYPPLLLPWYRHPEKPWPLIKKPIRTDSIVREASSCTIEVDVTGQDPTISIRNTGAEDISMTGVLIMTNLATGAQQELDFFWGEASVLNSRLSLLYKGQRHPPLWSDPEDPADWYGHIQHPGREHRFILEKSFRDVKAFSLYTGTL